MKEGGKGRPRARRLPRLTLAAPPALLQGVAKYAEWGHDPLGAREPWGSRAAVEGALGGLGDFADRTHAHYVPVRGQDVTAFDLVFARLAAARGVDPLALAWLHAFAHETMTVRLPDGGSVSLGPGGDDDQPGHVDLGAEASWWTDGTLCVPGAMSDTIMASMVGRPLSQILSHPELDHERLTVAGALVVMGETAITVEGTRPPATADALLELSTRLAADRRHHDPRTSQGSRP